MVLIAGNIVMVIALMIFFIAIAGYGKDGLCMQTAILGIITGFVLMVYTGVLPTWVLALPILIISALAFSTYRDNRRYWS